MAKILIMEDDIQFAFEVRSKLEKNAHQVEWSRTASEAFELMEKTDFDLLISDVFVSVDGKFVPDGGINLLGRVRESQKFAKLPVIVVTASRASEFTSDYGKISKALGARFAFTKPLEYDEFLAAVDQALLD